MLSKTRFFLFNSPVGCPEAGGLQECTASRCRCTVICAKNVRHKKGSTMYQIESYECQTYNDIHFIDEPIKTCKCLFFGICVVKY